MTGFEDAICESEPTPGVAGPISAAAEWIAPPPAPSPDNVNSPPHYQSSHTGIECIEAIEAALTPAEFRGYLKGNVIKYTWRERLKGGDESLAKAGWYLRRLGA